MSVSGQEKLAIFSSKIGLINGCGSELSRVSSALVHSKDIFTKALCGEVDKERLLLLLVSFAGRSRGRCITITSIRCP